MLERHQANDISSKRDWSSPSPLGGRLGGGYKKAGTIFNKDEPPVVESSGYEMPDYLPLAKHINSQEDYRREKELRKDASFAERLLWNDLRLLPKDSGFKFRRQYPIHPYIVDFACVRLKLVIEIDGESHDTRLHYDAARDNFLKQRGYIVLRFLNEDVYESCEGVVMQIIKKAKDLAEGRASQA